MRPGAGQRVSRFHSAAGEDTRENGLCEAGAGGESWGVTVTSMRYSVSGSGRRLLALCAAGLAGFLLWVGDSEAAESLPETSQVLRRMVERSQAVAAAERGPRYLYDKRSVVEELDAQGQTIKSEERLHEVTLIAGFPFNRLVKVQGRELTAEELKKEQRKEERFRQRIASADPKVMAARKEAWVTGALLDRYQFVVQDRVTLSNRATLVLNFRPKTNSVPAKTLRDKLLNRMAGTVWVDEQEAEAVKLEVALKEPVSFGWLGILGSLDRCELALERQRLPEGLWANTRQILLIHGRKLAGALRVRATEQSSGFRKADPAS